MPSKKRAIFWKSGNVTHANNTTGVLIQLEQCKATKVLNPETHLPQLPDTVYLISTYPVPDKDVAGADSLLENLRKMGVRIIGPDALVDLIRQHMPDAFDDVASPGHGFMLRYSAYLNQHHEVSAFAPRSERTLDAFFVNLGFAPHECTASRLSRGDLRVLRDRDQPPTELPRERFQRLATTHLVLKEPLTHERLFTLARPKSGRRSRGRAPKVGPAKSEVVVRAVHAMQLVSRIDASVRAASKGPASASPRDAGSRLQTLLDGVELLNLLESAFRSRLFVERHTKSPAQPVRLEIGLGSLDPQALLFVDDDICILGEAGGGKTSIARMVAREAIRSGKKVVYFPCARLESQDADLAIELTEYLSSIAGEGRGELAKRFLKEAEVLILDGCDEAANSRTTLAGQIAHLALPMPLSVEMVQCPQMDVTADLSNRLRIDRDKRTIHLIAPLSRCEQLRAISSAANEASRRALEQLFSKAARSRPKLIVTTRATADIDLPASFRRIQVRPFNNAQLNQFFDRWFAHCNGAAQSIQAFLRANKHIREVCRTPIVATIVAALHETKRDLPKSRTEVYERRFDLLLSGWDIAKGVVRESTVSADDKRHFLSALAWELHTSHRRRFSSDDASQIWQGAFAAEYPQVEFRDLLAELAVSNNVIMREGSTEFSLGHLSYQEYLAALHVVYRQRVTELVKRIGDPWWRQVALFYVGITRDATPLLDELLSSVGLPRDAMFLKELKAEARFTRADVRHFINELVSGGDDDVDVTNGNIDDGGLGWGSEIQQE
ncbi:MAG: NACHT domain-containing protein [Planctomycetaceae bacterium]